VNDLLKLAVEGLDPTVVTRGHLSITSKWFQGWTGSATQESQQQFRMLAGIE
jgi:hypothetical protein